MLSTRLGASDWMLDSPASSAPRISLALLFS
jgi:hypothetical protein